MSVVSADWVVPVEAEPIAGGAVAIAGDGTIAEVGTIAELGRGEHHPESVIVPGLVNAHSHLEYAVYAGFGDGSPFTPWLRTHMERKGRLDDEAALAIARLGAAESLAAGVTTTADYSYTGAAAVACAELGLRAIVYLEVFGRDPDEALARFDRLRQRVGEPGGDVRFGVSPHAPYTCSLDVYDACASLALPLGTHLAESGAEREWLVHGAGPMAELAELFVPPTGETAIRSLAGRGLLRPGLLAAHCVDVDDEEIALLAEGGVGVAHCPRSNAMLGCGIAPLATLRAATARVGLGTDSPASTPSLDPFAELRAAVLGARARERRPDALSAADALELATLGSARALGIDGEVGSIRVGKRADLAILSFAGTGWLPWDDPVTAVVLGGRPERVVGTLVDGHPRYERGRTAWHGLTDAARSARSRMLP